MEELNKVLSTEPTENPSDRAKVLASKLYTDWLVWLRDNDWNDFFDIFIRLGMRGFVEGILAKSYQTLIDNGDVE